eukprot:Skav206684  [mRNA]  locus=scaffold1895:284835:286433:+ [translate_table: standard]
MKSGEKEKRSSVTVLQDVPEEIPRLKIKVGVDADEISICSRTTSTIRPDSPLEGGSATPISPKSMHSQNSSRSNLERLKVPWDVRSLNSVKDFNDLAPTNDYSMDEELGVGGFGTVFKGTSKSDGKEVAIKIIKRERLHSEENFQEELKVARKLAHPNIDPANYYLVMEFCCGGTLAKYVGTKTMQKDDLGLWNVGLETEQFAQYAWQMLSGAAYLHHCKIVHRDIKLENYMRVGDEDDASLKLIDMGLACRFKNKKRLQDVVGTVLTMAPEVRNKDYDERVDVWGIGMCLYMSAVCMDPWYNPESYAAMEEEEILAALDDPNLKLNYHDKRWNLKPGEMRSLVESLLVVNPAQRPRARQVMSTNKWLILNGNLAQNQNNHKHIHIFSFLL